MMRAIRPSRSLPMLLLTSSSSYRTRINSFSRSRRSISSSLFLSDSRERTAVAQSSFQCAIEAASSGRLSRAPAIFSSRFDCLTSSWLCTHDMKPVANIWLPNLLTARFFSSSIRRVRSLALSFSNCSPFILLCSATCWSIADATSAICCACIV